jgi:DNA-binding GntR family transcriptional regulator
LRPSDLSTSIVETLKRELGDGQYGPSASFTELALSERFGVSRTPVREALLILERDGLLVQLERGFGLPRYTQQNMADLFAVRRQLEPYAFRRIVETSNVQQLDRFVVAARQNLETGSSNLNYIQTNLSIRQELLALCPNRHIREAIDLFDHQTAFIRQQTLRDPKTREISIDLNRRLIDAVAANDPNAVEAATLALLDAAQGAIIRVLSTSRN